jgi:hypothetical protein
MAKKIIKWTCISLLVALVLIQFYRPAKNIDPTTPASDITVAYQTPPEITQILHKALIRGTIIFSL